MLSVESYVLSKKYTDNAIIHVEEKAIDEAVRIAVAESKAYTDERISVATFHVQIVETLPSSDIDEKCIYFVPDMVPTTEADGYYEYIYLDNKWELIGHTKVDLTNYWTIEQVKEYVASQEYHLTPATYKDLGGVIVDEDTMTVDRQGKISLNVISENDIRGLFNTI